MPTAATRRTMTCPKCQGTGDLPCFAGIANGVCFTCAGRGTVAYRVSRAKVRPLTDYQAGIIETIKTADLSGMTFGQLSSLRDFAHWPIPQCPELLSIWRERGEGLFMAAQEERLAAY